MKARSTSEVLKKIDCPHLSLYQGEGYWYFVYDDGKAFETRSVYTLYLNSMDMDQWVEEGAALVKQMKDQA